MRGFGGRTGRGFFHRGVGDTIAEVFDIREESLNKLVEITSQNSFSLPKYKIDRWTKIVMQVDVNTKLTIVGSTFEIRDMLEVIRNYILDDRKPVYFTHVEANGIYLDFLSDDEITEISAVGKIKVTADGSYGDYRILNDVDIFREMAEAAPNATFEAYISYDGYDYEWQKLKYSLKDGRLHITIFFMSEEEPHDAWKEDFKNRFPLKKFKELFAVTGRSFTEKSYDRVLDEFACHCYDGFEGMRFDDFVSVVEWNHGEAKMEESRYHRAMGRELSALGIKIPHLFEVEYEGGETNEYVYDPFAKVYERKPSGN